MLTNDGKAFRVFLDRDMRFTLHDALLVAPGWDSMWINRHENGWVFVSAGGRRYVFDNLISGWIPLDPDQSLALYNALGKEFSSIYIELERHNDNAR